VNAAVERCEVRLRGRLPVAVPIGPSARPEDQPGVESFAHRGDVLALRHQAERGLEPKACQHGADPPKPGRAADHQAVAGFQTDRPKRFDPSTQPGPDRGSWNRGFRKDPEEPGTKGELGVEDFRPGIGFGLGRKGTWKGHTYPLNP
jgi:hypothetical protein